MQRYFVSIIDNNVIFNDDDIHHILHVMRNRVGDHLEVVNDGKVYECEITSINPLKVNILWEIPQNSELKNDLVLFMCLAKGDKLDLIIQKATELGASKIVLVKSKRCVVNYDSKDINKKLDRFNKIAKEASEQSHRLVIPSVLGIYDIKNIPSELLCDINYVAYEKLADSRIEIENLSNSSVSILIGPEGGIEEKEIEVLRKQGFKPLSLGKRILRCETAAINALSVLGYLMER